MNRKHLHIAVTAGLAAALSLGAAPALAEEYSSQSFAADQVAALEGSELGWSLSYPCELDPDTGYTTYYLPAAAGGVMLPETITVGSFPDYFNCPVSWTLKDDPGADINK